MWNQYYYFDLPKIRVGQACRTKKLPSPKNYKLSLSPTYKY